MKEELKQFIVALYNDPSPQWRRDVGLYNRQTHADERLKWFSLFLVYKTNIFIKLLKPSNYNLYLHVICGILVFSSNRKHLWAIFTDGKISVRINLPFNFPPSSHLIYDRNILDGTTVEN
jgi:hypothetical protein